MANRRRLTEQEEEGLTLKLMRDGGTLAEWRYYVGPGWWPILERLHERLAGLDPDYRAGQVKEKFGGLRVYLNTPMPPGGREAIDAAGAESLTVCETCGEPGRRRGNTADGPPTWIKTLCDQHARLAGYRN
jgi:hypothetical protein